MNLSQTILIIIGSFVIVAIPVCYCLKDTIIESLQRKKFTTPGVEAIRIERKEQIQKHRHTRLHDQRYVNGELQSIAKYCLTQDFTRHWPEKIDPNLAKKIFAKNRKEQLIIAGACIAAELDRLHHE
jgi:hypothetical protein